jgi:transposase, IS605 orfB family
MIRAIKLRLYPNAKQKEIIINTLGCCRSLKNLYIEWNNKEYETNKKFINAFKFDKLINKLKKENSDYKWISKCASKAKQEAVQSAERSYQKFFKKHAKYPKFRKRKDAKESFYFVNELFTYYTDNKNIIKIPKLGRIRISSGEDLPEDPTCIKSGRVVREYDKYYVVFIYNKYNDNYDTAKRHIKLGIDLGVKDYATIYDGKQAWKVPHFKDNPRYKELYNKITALRKVVSRKAEYNYGKLLNIYMDKNGPDISDKDKKRLQRESRESNNINKLQARIGKLNKKMVNIRMDFIKKLCYDITARIKPYQINIEDLSVINMLKNTKDHKLLRYIKESGFYIFKEHLISKCVEYGVDLNILDPFYPSTKTCCACESINNNITLTDRTFECPVCGLTIDRDINASINIHNA